MDIKQKMKKSFSPPEVENNPVLQILQYHVFPGPVLSSSGGPRSRR
jgi:hypothetical protein